MNDVYLTYNDDIVFLSGTPASVGMDSMGTHKMGTVVYILQTNKFSHLTIYRDLPQGMLRQDDGR